MIQNAMSQNWDHPKSSLNFIFGMKISCWILGTQPGFSPLGFSTDRRTYAACVSWGQRLLPKKPKPWKAGEFVHERTGNEQTDKGVSKNNGTPKWMVYNGKPY